jgi:hypothetical protein
VLQKKIDAEEYAFEVVNAGVSGDTSAEGCAGSTGRFRETSRSSSSRLAETTRCGGCR